MVKITLEISATNCEAAVRAINYFLNGMTEEQTKSDSHGVNESARSQLSYDITYSDETFQNSMFPSHYGWLERNFIKFCELLNLKGNEGDIRAHGDKCYSYREMWAKNGIPFSHGVAMYLLTYYFPYTERVRKTENGWVCPEAWVVLNYPCFKQFFNKLEMAV